MHKENVPVRVVVSDENYLVRQGLKSIFDSYPGFEIIEEVSQFEELTEKITKCKPDLVIIGLNIQGVSGEDIIRQILKQRSEQKIIVVDTKEDVNEIISILRMGVQGYILKHCDKQEILDAVHAVVNGKTFFCSNVMKLNKSASAKEIILSERELQVLSLISEGLTNNEIADKIYLSAHTIASHRKNLMKKFEANNNVDLVIKAIKEKFIAP